MVSVDLYRDSANKDIGYQQIFQKKYFVTIKHKDGKKTKGCHIRQAALTVFVFSNRKDAKVPKPVDPSNNPHSRKQQWAFGSAVFIFDYWDYDGSETYINSDGNAEIEDTPYFSRAYNNSLEDQVSKYTFLATNWVLEDPTAGGFMKHGANFYFDGYKKNQKKAAGFEWWAKSSDGKVDEHESSPVTWWPKGRNPF